MWPHVFLVTHKVTSCILYVIDFFYFYKPILPKNEKQSQSRLLVIERIEKLLYVPEGLSSVLTPPAKRLPQHKPPVAPSAGQKL